MKTEKKMQVRNVVMNYMCDLPGKLQENIKANIKAYCLVNNCSVLDGYLAFADNQCLHGNDDLAALLSEISY